MPVNFSEIGVHNQKLVLALKNNKTSFTVTLPTGLRTATVAECKHAETYNYDLSYGMHGINNKRSLPGTWVGDKYYCILSDYNWDMAKRIVHQYDRMNKARTQRFYRLIHTGGNPAARDNSYRQCDEIVGIP